MPAYYLEIAVVALGLVLLMLEAFVERADRRIIAYLAITGLAGIFVANFFVVPPADTASSTFWSYYTADSLAMFYKAIALLTTILVLVMSVDYTPVLEQFTAKTQPHGNGLGEFFCLPVFVCAGLMWMASATDLTSIFVSLETVAITFYILVAYLRRNVLSLEAGVKYLILGALSTGFLVYGITWTFGITGQTNLDQIARALQGLEDQNPVILFAFALLFTGLAFKIAAVPFQIWVPDVYQGAATPITTFLSVGSKAAGFIVLTRVIEPFLQTPDVRDTVIAILLIVAGATLVYGSLAAIPQSNFKRLLAYSSISHAGFLLLALACVNPNQFGMPRSTVVAFYLAAYLLMTVLCFMVLAIIRRTDDSEEISTFDGLHQRSPFLAFALLIGVVSLAGVPLTAGFLGKLFVFNLAIDQGHFLALGIAILGAAAGFYYYLKVARSMYWNPAPNGSKRIIVSPFIKGTLFLLVAAILVLGVYPAPVLNLLP